MFWKKSSKPTPKAKTPAVKKTKTTTEKKPQRILTAEGWRRMMKSGKGIPKK